MPKDTTKAKKRHKESGARVAAQAFAEELSLLTVEDVTALLKVKRGWLYDQVQAGEFPHVRMGRRLRFRPQDIRDYLEANYEPVVTWPGSPCSGTSGQRRVARRGQET